MKHRILALVLAGMLTAAATACGSTNSKTSKNADAKPTVAYKDMQVGETATDLKADLKILDKPHRSGGFRFSGLHQRIQCHVSEHHNYL